MSKKILITGSAGFIGFHLAQTLSLDPNNFLVLTDNLQRGRLDSSLNELQTRSNVKFYAEDLLELDAESEIWGYYDEIYHLAAMVGVKHCVKNPQNVLEINILSTLNIIKLAKKNSCKKIVFSSTCETYSSGYSLGLVPVPTDESVPLMISDIKNPRLSYAVSKIAGEQLIIFNAPENYDYTIVRYHNIYGPRMGYVHVIPEVIKRICKKEKPFKIYGYNQTRSFCYIKDAIAQTIAVMRSDQANDEVIHVGNDREEIEVAYLVKKVFSILGYDVETENIEAPVGSVNRRCPDISKMTRMTGLLPQVSLDEGLDVTIKWYTNEIEQGRVWE